jgi:drug/metabolite transporter (DMT)-like permease
MYFLLVRDWGASRPGTYAFISPVIAVVLGCSFFGEKLDWGDAVGMTLMLGAAGLALRPAGINVVAPVSTQTVTSSGVARRDGITIDY